jgi:hypothetical protein
MENVFNTEPNWSAYVPYSMGTKRTKQLFSGETDIPQGSILSPLNYNGLKIETPLKAHLLSSDYQQFFFLNKIAFNSRDLGYIYVDIWFLSEGLR